MDQQTLHFQQRVDAGTSGIGRLSGVIMGALAILSYSEKGRSSGLCMGDIPFVYCKKREAKEWKQL
jgi:hypothetical protein